ncbi:MAG: CofH family radical SAM protein [Candidatus Thalassarchaeaceae archaeon]|jgi:aminodeoxyfutalosine synthase|nr:CofH family radical SAM protein [Candidatus Thalassarchaeaceae archaeon]MDP7658808.1 CofH family radical SAM protein [Candidatus Thalassarchaeaceae archaeon]
MPVDLPLGGYDNWQSRLASTPISDNILSNPILNSALSQLINSGRITKETGFSLFDSTPLFSLMNLANIVKEARYGKLVFFNENLHINPTNICVLACRFCAFRKGVRNSDAYELSADDFVNRIEPFSPRIDEIHSVGGLHPTWRIEHYEQLYANTKEKFPNIHIKSLSAVEIKHLAIRSNISVSQVLQRLSASGLDSIPGGGAEILVDSIRDRLCRGKESSQEYLDIHKQAHLLNIPTNCTMLFGTIETIHDRITHLTKLRDLQDVTGGFQCFVPYPFLADNSRLPEAKLSTGNDILRVIAVSRLMLDNIPHIKAYRMNIGDNLGQIALLGGADDIDGTVGHEEIMHSAGSNTSLSSSSQDLCKLIEQVDCIPVKRNSIYSKFEISKYSTPELIDLPLLV